MSGYSWSCQVPRAPLHAAQEFPRSSWSHNHVNRSYPAVIAPTGSCVSPHPSLLPRCYPRDSGSGQVAVSPGWEEDLPDVLSAYLSLRAWPPPPAAREVHVPVSSPTTAAFPPFGPGWRSTMSVQRLQYGALFEAAVIRACSGPQVCSPPRSLLPLRYSTARQPWFLRPSFSWFITSPCLGYACRPNRAIDGRGLSPHQIRSLVGCSPNAGR